MSSLNELVAEYITIRTKRLQLEKEADGIKKGREGELSAQILQVMSAQGLKSANVSGLGRVVCRETSHYEIHDIESLALQMLKVMVSAVRDGRPISDGLLLQRRVHRENLDSLLGEGADESTMINMGVKKAVRTELSFTKE